jgi:hypothetical protein
MEKSNKPTSYNEITEIIVAAIENEPLFTKGVLIPKIRALMSGFKVQLHTAKYDAIERPTETARRLREIEKLEFERNFWKKKTAQIVGSKIEKYFDEIDEQLKERGFMKTTPNPLSQ